MTMTGILAQDYREYEDTLINFLDAVNNDYTILRDQLYVDYEAASNSETYYYWFTNPSKCTYSWGHTHIHFYASPALILAQVWLCAFSSVLHNHYIGYLCNC